MRFTILSENRKKYDCDSEEGFSIFINTFNKKIMLDTGFSDLFIKNSQILNIDLRQVDDIILSHGHSDHSNGIAFFPKPKKKINLLLHPDCFLERYSIRRNMHYAGMNRNLEELSKTFNVIMSRTPYFLCKNICYLGEIERKNNFEAKVFPSVLNNNKTDYIFDDTALVIKSSSGLIIISGCSHSGICNIIEYSKKIMNEKKVYAVIGGLHLKYLDDLTYRTIEYFKYNRIPNLYIGHCTSDDVIEVFKNELTTVSNVVSLYSGLEFEID